MNEWKRSSGGTPGRSSVQRSTASPGKRALTDGLVQRRATADAATADAATGADAVATATQGTQGAASALPHLPAIQSAFGRHDVSGVEAFVGGPAADASHALGAEAYAVGDQVAFSRSPDLHLAAHEAAHVVQQRAGVHLKGGLGEAGDIYERHADAVADAVVRGESAESLLDAHHGGGSTAVQQKAVQRFLDPAAVADNFAGAVQYIKEKLSATGTLAASFGKEFVDAQAPGTGKKAKAGDSPAMQALRGHAAVLTKMKTAGEDPAGYTEAERGDVKQIVRLLNGMEQEVATAEIARKTPEDNVDAEYAADPASDIKIGTEFTFSTAALQGMRLGDSTDTTNKTKVATAEGLLKAWVDEVLAKNPSNPPAVTKAKSAKSASAMTFTYRIDADSTWSWTVDLDDGCLETQTQPSSRADLRANKTISNVITRDIFGAAATVGLQPDPTATGGGGHISLDGATSFGGSVEVFLAFVLELQTSIAAWKKVFQDDDKLNAPWLDELAMNGGEPLALFKTEVERMRAAALAGDLDIAMAAAQIKVFNRRIKNPEAEAMAKSSDKKLKDAGNNVRGNPDHYQAINIEHMNDDSPASRRLELRRVEAQIDPATLFAQLDHVFGVMMDVRGAVQATQKQRLQKKS